MQKTILKYKLSLAFFVLLGVFATSCRNQQPLAVSQNIEPEIMETSEVSRFPQSVQMAIDYAFLVGMRQLIIEDYVSALNTFFEVLSIDNQHAPAHFQISRIRLMQGQFSEAEIHAERAWRLSPNNKFYLRHLAEIYRHNNRLTHALSSYERLITLDPRNEDLYLLEMANLNLMLRRPMETLRILNLLEERHGVSEELSMQKISIFQALGQEAGIRNELEKLIREFPNDPRFFVLLGDFNIQTGRPDEAFDNFQKALSLDPEDPYVRLALVEHYQLRGDTTSMLEQLVLALENPRLDIDVKVAIMIHLLQVSEGKENIYRMLDAILSAHPNEPKALALYADFLLRHDRYEEARDKYRKVVALDDTQWLVWEALLITNLMVLDTTGLVQDGKAALERFPEQPLVYYIIGTGYHLKRDYVMAMQFLEQAAALAESNPRLLAQVHSDLGNIYHFLGDHERSDRNFRKALELEPENYIALNNFSYFLALRRENLEEAEQMSLFVVQRNPTNSTFLDTHAWVLFKQGRFDDARVIMELAIEFGGYEHAIILEQYGDILWKTGDKERALEQWKKAQAMEYAGSSQFLDEKIQTRTWIGN
ncbi:MAG: tetratricopeptide repeat protein [Bacteroidales bacterium]|nr:tetratricopeptide repeat protein [Bacteroidales bacterium]